MTIELEESREPTIFNSPVACLFVSIFLFVALLFRQSDLSLLAFLVLLVMAAAKIWSRMSHYRVAYSINLNKQRAFPGETFTLEVGSFHKNTAKDAFESTLEVIASLAVQFYNKGCAVGLATNGVVTGGGSSNLAATRAAGQLPAMLEILARLQLSPKNALEPIMRRILGSGRGFSCAFFQRISIFQWCLALRSDPAVKSPATMVHCAAGFLLLAAVLAGRTDIREKSAELFCGVPPI
jgi:hypothetical protein